MIIRNYTSIADPEFEAIRKELPEHENLQSMIGWALADQSGAFIPGVVSRVVVQDEFSHDVLVPWRRGLTLVYETT